MSKKLKILLATGSINIIHGLLHLIQAFQSFFIASHSIYAYRTRSQFWVILHQVLEHPATAILFTLMGILTIWIGIKDFKFHSK